MPAAALREPATAAGPTSHRRSMERRAAVGFLTGVALGAAATAVHFAWAGYRVFPMPFCWHLVLAPLLGTVVAVARDPAVRQSPERFSWRRIRLSTRVLMFAVAYLAVLMGLTVTTGRLGVNASVYHGRVLNARHMASVFYTLSEQAGHDARTRLESARAVREGRVSPALSQGQQDFLRSLDAGADPEFRRRRYALIADGEERLGRLAEHNAPGYANLARYYEALAAKYARAERQPWRPVAPDPPVPTFR